MNRREVLAAVLGAAGAPIFPDMLRAQPPLIKVGYLDSTSPTAAASHTQALRNGLKLAGFNENKDIQIIYRWAQGKFEYLPALATQLVDERVSVMVAASLPAALAAKKAAPNTPIVFVISADPVEFGLVSSMARPEGNITGVAQRLGELGRKRMELLHATKTDMRRVTVLANPNNPHGVPHSRTVQSAADELGVETLFLPVTNESDMISACAIAGQMKSDAMLIIDDPIFGLLKQKLVDSTIALHIRTMFFRKDFVEAGGLMSYGPNFSSLYERVGALAGRMLKDQRPSDVPVEEPDIFELVLNEKTAASIGLKFPANVLIRADLVIS